MGLEENLEDMFSKILDSKLDNVERSITENIVDGLTHRYILRLPNGKELETSGIIPSKGFKIKINYKEEIPNARYYPRFKDVEDKYAYEPTDKLERPVITVILVAGNNL